MKLYAISDLHLGVAVNREGLKALPPHPDDWLILAGDVGETEAHFHYALYLLTRRFAQVIWTPGNHDLWTLPTDANALRGEAKYQRLVTLCHDYGVLTPEDPYIQWPAGGPPTILAPTFVLYDYSFRPDNVPIERAVTWAAESGVVCADEAFLYPDPYPSRAAWCQTRLRYTEPRLQEAADRGSLILINHFPLRQDHVHLPRIPRFSVWCGTRHTEEWPTRYRVRTAVYGHLHIRATRHQDGTRFEEVSLGYASQWQPARGIESYLREIL
ncbi:MAG: metallophosphoesterase [Chloroflexota bacterium]